MSDVDELLSGLKAKKVTKVLLLGNSGVGKSMLLNTVLARLAFESKMSLTRVTTKMDVAVYQAGDEVYLLYNIPGLADPDEQIALENAAIIEQAIRDRADLPTIAFFVLTVEGGRLRPEDINAWRSISTFVPGLKDKTAVSFIVNKVNFAEFEADKERFNFQLSLRRTVHKLFNCNFDVHMLPLIVTIKERADLQSASMSSLRLVLVAAMIQLRGKKVSVCENAKLKLLVGHLQSEIAALTRQIEEMRVEFARQAQTNDEQHKAALADMQRQNKASLAAMEEVRKRQIISDVVWTAIDVAAFVCFGPVGLFVSKSVGLLLPRV